MITSKQRSYLMRLAQTENAIFQIGKSTLTPEVTEAIDEALTARELVKINMLKNCDADLREVAGMLSERTHSEVVQIIGRKIILFRRNHQKGKIVFTGEKA